MMCAHPMSQSDARELFRDVMQRFLNVSPADLDALDNPPATPPLDEPRGLWMDPQHADD